MIDRTHEAIEAAKITLLVQGVVVLWIIALAFVALT